MEVPVFTETSLGTRVALSAPPDISAAELKSRSTLVGSVWSDASERKRMPLSYEKIQLYLQEFYSEFFHSLYHTRSHCEPLAMKILGRLEREYFGGFPGSGPVKAHGLMVKRRSFFYHLPDSMPIKYVFDGATGAWFLHADLRPSDDLSEPHLQDCIEPHLLKREENAIHSKEKGNKSWLESHHLNRNKENESDAPPVAADNLCEPERSGNPTPMDETSNGSSSAISIGGIIERYFCSDEVTNCITGPVSESKAVQSRAKERTNASAEFAVKTPPRPSLRDKGERSRVGKRLVTASHLLGVSPTQKTVPDLCRSQNGKVSRCSRGIRYPVFEISDSSDNQSNL